MTNRFIQLIRLSEEHTVAFKEEMKEAFQHGFMAYYKDDNQWQVLPDKDFYQSLGAEGAEAYEAVNEDGQRVGGAIITVNGTLGELAFLYVKVGVQSKGIGQSIWKSIENMHPEAARRRRPSRAISCRPSSTAPTPRTKNPTNTRTPRRSCVRRQRSTSTTRVSSRGRSCAAACPRSSRSLAACSTSSTKNMTGGGNRASGWRRTSRAGCRAPGWCPSALRLTPNAPTNSRPPRRKAV